MRPKNVQCARIRGAVLAGLVDEATGNTSCLVEKGSKHRHPSLSPFVDGGFLSSEEILTARSNPTIEADLRRISTIYAPSSV